MSAPPPSPKDGMQVLKYSFDDATGSIRTTAQFTGTLEVALDQATDSVAIGDGTTIFTGTNVGPTHSMDVNVTHSVLPDGAAQEHVTAGSPSSVRLSDGTSFYKATTPSDTQPVSATNLDIRDLSATQDNVSLANQAGTNFVTVHADGSLDVNLVGGAVAVDIAAASGDNIAIANQAGTNFMIVNPDGSADVTVVASALPTGASTAAHQVTEIASLSSIDSKLNSLGQKVSAASVPVVIASDQSAVPVSQSGTWNINNVSGTVSLPTGAATEATLAKLPLAQASTTSGQFGTLAQGAVSTAAPSYTNGQTDPLSLTLAGALRTDSSAVTQPVSAASLPLPTGAATSANQTTANSSLSSIDSKLNTLGQKTMANSVPVVIASDQSAISAKAATPTAGTITQAAISVGTSAVRATVSGSAPSANRSVLTVTPDPSSTAKFFMGSATVTGTGATRGLYVAPGESVAFNSDAGDYYIVSDTAAQTVFIMEQA